MTEMAGECFVPVIDISKLTSAPDLDFTQPDLKEVCFLIVDAFQKYGFASFRHHGISAESVEVTIAKAADFFAQDPEVKMSFLRRGDSNHGWVETGLETLNPERPGDLKEAFNVTLRHALKNWPDNIVPNFKDTMVDFLKQCDVLSQLVLKAMAVGLELKDVEYFTKAHDNSHENMTTLRCLHYPPLPPAAEIQKGQIRCGEHSDYGSITLLFQDGGIEVLTPEGEWWSPPHIPGTVMANIGDLMQRWTSDRLKSTKHRVSFPLDEVKKQRSRRSMAFFVHPTDSWMIECLDGSQKYPPISSLDYLNMRFKKTNM